MLSKLNKISLISQPHLFVILFNILLGGHISTFYFVIIRPLDKIQILDLLKICHGIPYTYRFGIIIYYIYFCYNSVALTD